MSHSECIDIPETDGGNCAFCAYLSGERPYAIVSRSDLVVVMVTREPRGEPHALVVPQRHCETILGLTDEESAEVMLATRNTARAIEAVYCRDGIAVWQNNGISAHQAIPHVHVHVAGTLDEGGTDWGDVEEVPLSDAYAVADRLRPHLAPWQPSLLPRPRY
jgi:histidine triad (HIT) family protein